LSQDQAGNLIPGDDGRTFVLSTAVNGKDVQFIEHNSIGSTIGSGNVFRFMFQTPADPDFGPIRFNVAGNAANGNGANTGDFIYATETTLPPISVQSERQFVLATRGSLSTSTNGANASFANGFARMQSSGAAGSGLEFIGYRRANTLITEPAFSAAAPIRSGRIYAEMNAPVNTGVALANPNTQMASVSVVFSDASGAVFSTTSFTIPPNSQIAGFLHEAPFSSSSSTTQRTFTEVRTFTFSSNVPLAAMAVRTRINERGEFMMVALPVADISATAPSTVSIPHFASGGVWGTEILLVNNGDASQSGTMRFLSPAGQSVSISLDGQTNSQFQYAVPARSSRRFQTSGGSGVATGWIEIAAASGSSTPLASAVIASRVNNVTTSETSLNAASAANAFRVFAEAAGNFTGGATGSMQSGVLISNPSTAAVSVTVEVTTSSGSVVGSAPLSVPSRGQAVLFLSDISGAAMAAPFTGTIWVSVATGTSIVVSGVRTRYNERGDYLLTSYPAFDEAAPAVSDLIFPQIVDSAEYSTQFAMIGARAGQLSGSLRFFAPSGSALSLSLR
jgi:hypothetical protein